MTTFGVYTNLSKSVKRDLCVSSSTQDSSFLQLLSIYQDETNSLLSQLLKKEGSEQFTHDSAEDSDLESDSSFSEEIRRDDSHDGSELKRRRL
jgi:hypothetical protein